ncbi:MAG: TonB-dependent receptor [Bacteroidales bacterium]
MIPGGNPDLTAEKGINGELTLQAKRRSYRNGFHAGGEVTYFYSRIKDMIKWLPGDFGIWSPVNLADVRSEGAEADAEAGLKLNHSVLILDISYTYTSVTNLESTAESDDTPGMQLIYVPYHRANIGMSVNRGALYLKWTGEYTGLRYTTADNSMSLPSHLIHNLMIGISLKKGRNAFETALSVRNLFDRYYEQVVYYPMPGRSYTISLIYSFNGRK